MAIPLIVAAMVPIVSLAEARPRGTNTSTPPTSSSASSPLSGVVDDMYNAEYAKAQRLLEPWVKTHPEDFRAWNYLAEAMMDREMLREHLFNGAAFMQSGAVFRQRREPLPPGYRQRLSEVFDRAQRLEEARLRQNPKDQEALYWLGATYSGRTEFDFILLRSYLAAYHEGKQSLRDNERLLKLNPNFTDAYFVIGLAKYSIGTLPWYERLMVSLAGAHGSIPQGVADLERVSQHGHYVREDARVALVAVYERQKNPSRALSLLRQIGRAYPENYLAPLEAARIEEKAGNWRTAAQTYDAVVAKFVDGEKLSSRIPKAEILYRGGHAHERSGELLKALDFYNQASRLPSKSIYIYRSDFAAAQLDRQMNRLPEARSKYQIVASALPDSDIGKQARDALRSIN